MYDKKFSLWLRLETMTYCRLETTYAKPVNADIIDANTEQEYKIANWISTYINVGLPRITSSVTPMSARTSDKCRESFCGSLSVMFSITLALRSLAARSGRHTVIVKRIFIFTSAGTQNDKLYKPPSLLG